jgi:hypothetical protein
MTSSYLSDERLMIQITAIFHPFRERRWENDSRPECGNDAKRSIEL